MQPINSKADASMMVYWLTWLGTFAAVRYEEHYWTWCDLSDRFWLSVFEDRWPD